ncbi:MAG: hypothetical protein IH805_11205, partial [Proteobacteria bacterium]|nr:hypothetical protein [Pseudomonadota bacterium]
GIAIAPLDDTMLLSYVLDGGRHGHGMDELARLHLGHETIKFKDVAGSGKAQVTFDQVPLDKALDYAAEDADVTWRLHALLKPRLVPERMTTVYETLERPLVPVLTEMERAGIKVDRDALRRLSNDFAGRIAELEGEIHELAGRPFTIGSPKQLGEILFDEMGLPGGKRGKSGAYATGADILEGLAAQGNDLPARVLDWRQLSKLKSTYTDALQERINPETGRVHTSFSQAVASTGRLASSDPNLQNIPIRTEEGRKIRHAFVAEAGCTLLSVDYSQIELRLAAHIAGVESLRQAFLDGQDIHAITASQVFGVPVEGMDPMIRRQAKAINFGIIYGISAFGLANNLGIPQGEAKAYIEAYFERYPGIRDYMEKTKTFARANGYVATIFGRRCHVGGIADRNPARRGFAERQAINAPLQGSAAAIIKRVEAQAGVGEVGREVAVEIRVLDADPLTFYLQGSNTGSETTEEHRFRLGLCETFKLPLHRFQVAPGGGQIAVHGGRHPIHQMDGGRDMQTQVVRPHRDLGQLSLPFAGAHHVGRLHRRQVIAGSSGAAFGGRASGRARRAERPPRGGDRETGVALGDDPSDNPPDDQPGGRAGVGTAGLLLFPGLS